MVATDLNAAMIDVARAKFSAGEQVEFRSADAADLPFGDASFDAVVCQFGVMFFPDKPKSYREARRVLADGGRYLFNVFDTLTFNPCPRVVSELLTSIFEIDPPPFLQVPYGYASLDPIVAALQAAGFGDIRIDVINLKTRVEDPQAFAAAFVLGSPMAEQIRARGVDPLELVAPVESVLREQAFEDGCAPLRAILFDAAARIGGAAASCGLSARSGHFLADSRNRAILFSGFRRGDPASTCEFSQAPNVKDFAPLSH